MTKASIASAMAVAAALCATTSLADNQPAPVGSDSAATTQPTSDNAAQTPPAPTSDDEKIVCRKEPPPVGSRMGGRKVCHTVAEWRRIEAAARETTDEIQSRKHEPQGN